MGSVVPSSRFLAQAMLEHIRFNEATRLVEIGPGTGAITHHIPKHLTNPNQYLGIDVNPEFVERLRAEFRHFSFEEGSAEFLGEVIARKGWNSVTDVISSLPWTIFPSDLVGRILDSISSSIEPGGTFSTFSYLHGRFTSRGLELRRELERRFDRVELSPMIWKNIPPAYVYYCHKAGQLA